jgi:hypothetical protein
MLYRVHESRCGINRRDRRITRYIRNIADGGSAIHTGYGCRDACCLFDVHREQIARYGYCLFRLIDLPNDCLGLSRPVCPPAIISGSECCRVLSRIRGGCCTADLKILAIVVVPLRTLRVCVIGKAALL